MSDVTALMAKYAKLSLGIIHSIFFFLFNFSISLQDKELNNNQLFNCFIIIKTVLFMQIILLVINLSLFCQNIMHIYLF